MKNEKFIKELKKRLNQLELPYYSEEKIEFEETCFESITVYINFTLPYNSILNLVKFCELNNFSLGFNNGKADLCSFNFKKIRRIKKVKNKNLK